MACKRRSGRNRLGPLMGLIACLTTRRSRKARKTRGLNPLRSTKRACAAGSGSPLHGALESSTLSRSTICRFSHHGEGTPLVWELGWFDPSNRLQLYCLLILRNMRVCLGRQRAFQALP